MFSEADRLDMLLAVGAQTVTHDGGQFIARFDRSFTLVLEGVESSSPALSARTSDVKHLPKDTVLRIGDEVLRIKRQIPDGAGFTVVELRQ